MLNDLAWPNRIGLGVFGLALSLIVGAPWVASGEGSASFVLLIAGLVLSMALFIAAAVGLQVADRRVRERVVAGAGEIASGAVTPDSVPARVVRRRIDRRRGSFLPGRGAAPGPSCLVVLTVLPEADVPRRVAVLVPAMLGLGLRHQPAVVLLHPTSREVAVLDDRVTHADLAAADADPRWTTQQLPTDRRVAGGYLSLLASLVIGVVIGLAIDGCVLALT